MPSVSTEQLAKFVGMSRRRFLHGLEAVPEDRLNWSLFDGGRSVLQFADYVAGFLSLATLLIEEGAMPKERPAPPPPSTSREEAVARLTGAYDRLQATVRAIDENKLSATMIPPWRTEMTVAEMLWFLSSALGYFQGQLNLYQMGYGDTNPNIPPGWGSETD
jgi:hypothetical protein